MSKTSKQSNITVRGGIINVPPATVPAHPPRHQPDTPRTKKETTVRADHQPATPETPTAVTDSEISAAAPPVPPATDPEADPED